jgi:cellulose synthase operon protein C
MEDSSPARQGGRDSLRHRRRRRLGVVLGVVAAVAALLGPAAELSAVDQPSRLTWTLWILAGLLAAAALLVGVGLDWWESRQEELDSKPRRQIEASNDRRARERLIKQLISIPLRHPEVLPTVAQVDPYKVGVSRSNYVDHDPYITREADQSLDDALKNALFVLILGAPKAGKSRTAIEAAKRTMPLSKFIAPKPGLISDLINLEPRLDVGTTPAILWLDELDRYLASAGDLDLPLLDRLMKNNPPIVVLSTMTTQQYHRIRSTEGELGRNARLVLGQAKTITLGSQLTTAERKLAQQLYPKEDFQRGIGEQFVAVWEAERLYHDGPQLEPVGWAIVQAAIDRRLTGMTTPIQEAPLRELARGYLPSRGIESQPSGERFARGLAWAQEQPTASPVKLLELVVGEPDAGFEVFDYLVAYADQQGGPGGRTIPAATWELVIAQATAEEQVLVGITAYFRGDQEAEKKAVTAASMSSDTEVAALAARMLGEVLQDQGDLQAAKAAFQRAIDTQDPDMAPLAADQLGGLLASQGDLAGAGVAYQQAIGSGHADAAPRAAYNFGNTLPRVSGLCGGVESGEQGVWE